MLSKTLLHHGPQFPSSFQNSRGGEHPFTNQDESKQLTAGGTDD